jgi:anti-sigma factor RsiW
MSCDAYSEPLNAMLDGELPAGDMASLTLHLAECPDCARHLAELSALRASLQDAIPEDAVSPDFYEKIGGLLDREAAVMKPEFRAPVIAFKQRPLRRNWGWITAWGAVAAMLVILLMPHHDESRDLMSVRDAALRANVSQSVASNIPSPAVPGFRLAASRPDIVAGHAAHVFAYTRADQTVTLCIWAANGEPAHGVRNAIYRGMAISYWNDGKQEYWAATPGPAATLNAFVAALKTT